MTAPLAFFVLLCPLALALVAVGWALSVRLARESDRRALLRWLGKWTLKGLVVPGGLWLLMNVGLSWELRPFMPQVQAAQNTGTGAWVVELLGALAIGWFVISSYWTAATLGWSLVLASRGLEGDARKHFKGLCWTCGIGMALPAGVILLIGGWPTVGFAATAMLAPIAGYAPGLLQTKKMPPMYARAIARMKFGKYTEAEWEIIRELEKCEDDFQGWMMLAELYATHFHDIHGAEQTILEICDQPKTSPSQLSIALHKLADWYLKLTEDPDAARRALQMLCDRLPGTHLARMAQVRIRQLPATAEELREAQAVKPIPLPALGNKLEEKPAPAASGTERERAAEQARGCVQKLTGNPNDVAAREKLARLLAEQLDQPEQGIEQLRQLLLLPYQAEMKRAEWLSLTAAWQLKYRHDAPAGRRALEQIIQEFPQTPHSLAARRRLQLMEQEARENRQS